MPLSPGFPTDFTEYLTVWCADLLEGLDDEQRRSLQEVFATSYEGGPWPDRLHIQRLAEQTLGLFDADTAVGEWSSRHDGVAGVIARLHSREVEHEWVVEQLARLPGSSELVIAVNAACQEGLLSLLERDLILEAALSRPILPEPIPAPSKYPPIPADHPESYEEFRLRDPGYQVLPPFDDDIEAVVEALGQRLEAGEMDMSAFRSACHELLALARLRENDRDQLREAFEANELTSVEYQDELKRVVDRHPLPE